MNLFGTVICIIILVCIALAGVYFIAISRSSMEIATGFLMILMGFASIFFVLEDYKDYCSGEIEVAKYIEERTANNIKESEIEKILRNDYGIDRIYFNKVQNNQRYNFEVSYKFKAKDIHILKEKEVEEEPDIDLHLYNSIQEYFFNCEITKDTNTQRETNDIKEIMDIKQKVLPFTIEKGVLEDRVLYTLTFNRVIKDSIFVERKFN